MFCNLKVFLLSTLWKNVRERKWGKEGPDTAQMLNNSVTVTQGTAPLSLGKCSCQFLTSSPHLEPVVASSCFLYHLVMWNIQSLLDSLSKVKEKIYSPAFLMFPFCSVSFSHLNFHVLGRVDLSFCRLWSWQGVFACSHSSSPGACCFRYSPALFCAVSSVSVL